MKTKLIEYIYGLTEDEIKILILQSTFRFSCLPSIRHYLLQSCQECLNSNRIQNGRQTGQVGRWIINIGRHQRHVYHLRFGKQDFDFAFFPFFGVVREIVVLFNGSFVQGFVIIVKLVQVVPRERDGDVQDNG